MRWKFALAALAAAVLAHPAHADGNAATVVLRLKDHRFSPASVTVPAGRTVRIELVNEDLSVEEFDSVDLGVERDVTPKGHASFRVGPLKPGTYRFMGELHADTAQGEIKAEPEAGP